MFKILGNLLRKHALLHLILPLLGGFLVELGYGYLSPPEPGVSRWKEVLYVRSKVVAAGILVTYLAVMYIETKRETSVRFVDADLAELRGIMESASEVFATSTIPMEEWFQPISQVYFSIIVKQRFHRPQFKHERMILFFTQRDLDDVDLPYLDGYYARRLADLHREYEIPLSFIKPKELMEVVKSLSREQRKALHCCPAGLLQYLPATLLARRHRHALDFAVVKTTDSGSLVIRVSKKGERVTIEPLRGEPAKPYVDLADQIKRKAHDFITAVYPKA